MTKKVRVENADNSTYKVRFFVEDLVDGVWVRTGEASNLPYPADMQDVYIHSTRRVVVEEYDE